MHSHDSHPPSEPHDEIESIARAEQKRKRAALIKLALGALFVLAAGSALITLGLKGDLAPEVDVAAQEAAVLLETNDPQCRGMISDVSAFATRFKNEDVLVIEDEVLADSIDQVEGVRALLSTRREELERLRIASLESTLRYEDSPGELRDWFKGVDAEFRILDRRAEHRIASLQAKARGEEYVEFAPTSKKKKGKVVGEKPKVERTPREKVDAAVVKLYDLFASFRVWHTAGDHPCGAADDSETPWSPSSVEDGALSP